MPEMIYTRENAKLRLRLQGMTSREIRCLILGLWLRLDDDDKHDHIKELTHYLTDDDAPPISKAIAQAGTGENQGEIDLNDFTRN